jgi:hypothetical protein
MIVGAAQIVLNVAELDQSRQPYLEAGWRETFRIERLPNHGAKAGLQATERSSLDMVHLTPPLGIAHEVTRYADGPPAGDTVYELANGRVVLHAVDPDRSPAFWHSLGFLDRGGGILESSAVLPAWRMMIELRTSGGRRPATSVDAEGCVLVTLLTTGLERELERLRATGLLLRSTPPWTEQIASRAAVVAIVEGPSGELVELLEAPREQRDD